MWMTMAVFLNAYFKGKLYLIGMFLIVNLDRADDKFRFIM